MVFLFVVLFGQLVNVVHLVLYFGAVVHDGVHHILDHLIFVKIDALTLSALHLFWWFFSGTRVVFLYRFHWPVGATLSVCVPNLDSRRLRVASP